VEFPLESVASKYWRFTPANPRANISDTFTVKVLPELHDEDAPGYTVHRPFDSGSDTPRVTGPSHDVLPASRRYSSFEPGTKYIQQPFVALKPLFTSI